MASIADQSPPGPTYAREAGMAPVLVALTFATAVAGAIATGQTWLVFWATACPFIDRWAAGQRKAWREAGRMKGARLGARAALATGIATTALVVPPAALIASDIPAQTMGAMALCGTLLLRGMSIGAGGRRRVDQWVQAAALIPPVVLVALALTRHGVDVAFIAGVAGTAAFLIQARTSFLKQARTEADLRAAMHDLRAQKEIANLLFDQSSLNVVLCDRDMRILAVSQSWRDTIDRGRDSIGMSFYEAIPWCPQNWVKAHRQALAGRVVSEEEDCIRAPDGSAIYSRWEARPWRTARGEVGGVMIYGQDVTSFVAARRENQANLERLRHALDTVGAAVLEVDLSARTVLSSQNIVDVLGGPPTFDDVMSTQSPFIPLEDRPLMQAAMRAIISDGERRIVEHRIRRPDGTVAWVQTSGMRLSDKGRIVLLLSDITARKARESAFLEAMRQAETMLSTKRAVTTTGGRTVTHLRAVEDGPAPRSGDHIDELFERLAFLLRELDRRDRALVDMMTDLDEARTLAEAASQSKSQFLANMSHELRTPLNAVIGYAEILAEDLAAAGKDQSVEDAERIRKAGRHLLDLINEILDLSKIEAGRLDVRPERIDLHTVLRDIADVMQPTVQAGRNRLTVTAPPAPIALSTDVTRLRQCLFNLLSNAAKFTQDGDIEVVVDVVERAGGPGLRVRVRDTGIGMSAEQIGKLFQPFVQADPSATRRYGGTGLGLVITRRLARALGGDVEVASALGAGSTFTLTIACDLESWLSRQTANDPVPEARRLVLLADADLTTEAAVRAAGRPLGFETVRVEEAADVPGAARRLRPALIVLGLDRPDDSAWDVLDQLADGDLRAIPIVAIAPDYAAERLARTAASAHLSRPLDFHALKAAFAQMAPTLQTGGLDRAHPSR